MTYALSAERSRQAVLDHTARMAQAARSAGSDAPVPTAPEWDVADLVAHLGQTQHWVADILEGRVADPSGLPTEMAAVPSDPQAWPAWLGESSGRAAAAASDEALDAAVWNAAGDERTGGRFWLHSLINEAVVHGFDAAAASAGSSAAAARDFAIDADVATELITNHLAMLTSPTWAALRSDSADALRGDGQTLRWHATGSPEVDGPRDWYVERTPDGATWKHSDDPADATVSGPASALLLVLTRRWALSDGASDAVSIDGDAELVRHWIENTAHVAD